MAIGFKGTSISDIEQGAEDALEEDIANLSPASNSVAANLDGGVAAVDWESKSPQIIKVNSSSSSENLTISGSGYVTGIQARGVGAFDVVIDNSQILRKIPTIDTGSENFSITNMQHRFDFSFELDHTDSNFVSMVVACVLD